MLRLSPRAGLPLLALLLASLFLIRLPHDALWQFTLQDAGHGPVFAAIAGVLISMWPFVQEGGRRRLRDYAGVLAVCVVLGVVTELLQRYLPGRSVSMNDVVHDAAGAVAGLALFALLERRSTVHSRWAWAALLAALLLLAWQPVQVARAYAERRAAFPTLAPMGRAAEAAFVAAREGTLQRAPLPVAFREPGSTSDALELSFAAGTSPAFELVEPAPDWRGWSTLALDVTNPGVEPAQWILRILDAQHDWSHVDRLNLPVTIPPRTRTTVRVAIAAIERAPQRRPMDLGAIRNVMLFATGPPTQNTEFYVSRVWLE